MASPGDTSMMTMVPQCRQRQKISMSIPTLLIVTIAVTGSIACDDQDRLLRAAKAQVGQHADEVIRLAGEPDQDRRVVEGVMEPCKTGSVRAFDYHSPTGLTRRVFGLESTATVCFDANDKVTMTNVREY